MIILSGAGLALAGPSSSAFASTTVNGGGSSFAAPEALQWASEVAGPPDHLTINYTNSSSGNGRIYYANGNWDYGATDIIFNAEDQGLQNTVQQSHPFKYVTVSAGGLAFEYNIVIDGVKFTNLELTRQDVCGIFTGEITRWNQIAGTAPSDGALASLPRTRQSRLWCGRIQPARATSCPSTALPLTREIGTTSRAGSTRPAMEGPAYSDPNLAAGLPVSYWPGVLAGGPNHISDSALAASGAPAVAEDADSPNTPFAITYVATAYALQLGAPVARVQNGAGQFTQPTPNSIQLRPSVRQTPTQPARSTWISRDPTLPAYFPSTYSYVSIPTTTPHAASTGRLISGCATTSGRGNKRRLRLDYAPLSSTGDRTVGCGHRGYAQRPAGQPVWHRRTPAQSSLPGDGYSGISTGGPGGGFRGTMATPAARARPAGGGSSSAGGAGSSGTSSSGSGIGCDSLELRGGPRARGVYETGPGRDTLSPQGREVVWKAGPRLSRVKAVLLPLVCRPAAVRRCHSPGRLVLRQPIKPFGGYRRVHSGRRRYRDSGLTRREST